MSRLDADGRSNSGATASNAGDQYHLLWCVRKMLDMLHPRSDLQLITMEGVEGNHDLGDGPGKYLSLSETPSGGWVNSKPEPMACFG